MSSQAQTHAHTARPGAAARRRIFVTGAGGQTGLHVLGRLRDCADADIVAGVYEGAPEEAQTRIRQCCSNAEIRQIDADDLGGLVDAFRGTDALFIVPTATDHKVAHARNYIRAAKRASVPFVLLLSMAGAEARSHLFADQFRDIEETLLATGLPGFCVLRSSFYMQNLLLYRDEMRRGVLPLPVRGGAFNPVDVDDVAAAARAILVDCERHRGRWYTVAGPAPMAAADMAAAVSQALGQAVSWKDIPRSEARAILQRQRVPAVEINGLVDFYEAVAKHDLADQAANDFEAITGSKPTSLEAFFKRHRQEIVPA